MNQQPLKLIAAAFTPMHPDGSVNLQMIAQQAHALAEQEVAGAFICGTTGEGPSLSVQERKNVLEQWLQHRPEGMRIIAHVGHESIAEACELARHASGAGVDAVSAVSCSFFKPRSVEQLVRFCQPIAEAAAACPFYYYHSPGMTGVSLPMDTFLEQAGQRIANLAGIKFNDGDIDMFRKCQNLDRSRFEMLFGVDELLVDVLPDQPAGAIGSTYNYAADIYHDILRAWQANDTARVRYGAERVAALVEQLEQHTVLPAGKAMMAAHGVDCGPPRLPFAPLAPDAQQSLLTWMKATLAEFRYSPAPPS